MELSDNCSELQAFRKLRDDYLIKKPKGKVFIEFYYCLSLCILEIIIMKDTQIKFQIYHDRVIPPKGYAQDYELAILGLYLLQFAHAHQNPFGFAYPPTVKRNLW